MAASFTPGRSSFRGSHSRSPKSGSKLLTGDWEVIEDRKFTGWVLTERPDELIPDLHLKDGRHITKKTPGCGQP